jgi:hypothetical protein
MGSIAELVSRAQDRGASDVERQEAFVALVATELGRPDLRLSPTRVLAHYLPVAQPL